MLPDHGAHISSARVAAEMDAGDTAATNKELRMQPGARGKRSEVVTVTGSAAAGGQCVAAVHGG